MAIFLVTFVVMAVAVVGMAVGVIFGRSPIAGSCGGLNAVDDSGACLSCSRPCKSREQAKLRARMSGNEQPLVQADSLRSTRSDTQGER